MGRSRATPSRRSERAVVGRLRKPLERVIAHGHPWIWRDALEGLDDVPPGIEVRVLDRRGRFLARGLSDRGAIGVRVFTREDRAVDAAFVARRLDRAVARRAAIAWGDTDAMRLVHGEGDGLPGLVLDRYGAHAVMKLDGGVFDRLRGALIDVLVDRLPALGVETLIDRTSPDPIALVGALPADPIEIREHGARMWVDVVRGHKTGTFLDHRESRRRIREWSRDTTALNLFGYTGGFSIAMGRAAAREVTTVDVSGPALALADRSWALNGLAPGRHHAVASRVDEFLAQARASGRRFELVVSDPPNFAPRKTARSKALKAYGKLHRDVLDVVADGGVWLSASCSSHIDRAAFEGTIREAGHTARRRLTVLGRWGADLDHPIPIGFPEGDYLSVLVVGVDDDR